MSKKTHLAAGIGGSGDKKSDSKCVFEGHDSKLNPCVFFISTCLFVARCCKKKEGGLSD